MTESTSPGAPRALAEPAFRILALDGGGAKGFYTLGVLRKIEDLVGRGPLCERFDLIYGTSTGAIIAALLAVGRTVDEVHALYRQHVPTVMGASFAASKSAALEKLAREIFRDLRFEQAKTRLGIVAARWDFKKQLIFKSSSDMAFGGTASFVPGHGCSLSDAIQASCSAYPFFKRKLLTAGLDSIEAFDGGYCANNPTLYALADALVPLNIDRHRIRIVSIGVGTYPGLTGRAWLKRYWATALHWWNAPLLQRTLELNTLSMESLRELLFRGIPTVRINDTFATPEMATDFLERDLKKLNLLYQRGGESFARHEDRLRDFLLTDA